MSLLRSGSLRKLYFSLARSSRRGQQIVLAAAILSAASVHAGYLVNDTATNGVLFNFTTGANTFYDNGYYGGNAVIANVEAGWVWNGHETLTNVNTYVNDASITGQYDYHATMVGFVLNGLGPYNSSAGGYYYWQMGMAPGAKLVSAAVATDWVGNQGQFNTSDTSETYAYKTVMETGITYDVTLSPGITYQTTRKADVINSSWGYTDATGASYTPTMMDALAYNNHQTVVVAAGNHSSGTATVTAPATGYNNIAVGALQGDWTNVNNPTYTQVASFSNTGPADFYNPQTNQTITGVRAKVDIVAPGTGYYLPAYTGMTGQAPFTQAQSTYYNGANNLYAYPEAGTSFASPTVAGGAALLVDVGYSRFGGSSYMVDGNLVSVDGRVIKAILQNSADKIPGWNNGQTTLNGVVRTTQSLDYSSGAGAMNLTRAWTQYTGGTTDVPGLGGGINLQTTGWDYGQVASGAHNDYYINNTLGKGGKLTVTLDWFVESTYTLDAGGTGTGSSTRFDNLDLQVYKVAGDSSLNLVAESASIYNNVEHLNFDLPDDSQYMVRVLWTSEIYNTQATLPQDNYGLAWSYSPIPEPGAVAVLLGMTPLLFRRRRKQTSR